MARPRLAERAFHIGLTDDVLTLAAPVRNLRMYVREGVDRLAGADPGLTQLRTAVQAVLGIVVAVAGVDVFTKLSGALQQSSGPAAAVAAHNHAALVVSMLLAGMVAMMAGFVANEATLRGQIATTLIIPVPMLASMTCGLALGRYRVVSLVFLVALLSGAVYVRRWGPRGFACGLVAFNGGFLGFFLHTELSVRDVGWLAADLAIGVLASLLVRLTVLRPDPHRTLRRMRRSWNARVDRLLALAVATLAAPDARQRAERQEQLRRQIVRLNESTLMIDAQLATARPESAATGAQALFDAELALSNCVRFAAALAEVSVDQSLRELAVAALKALREDDPTSVQAMVARLRGFTAGRLRVQVIARRLGASVADYAEARLRLGDAVAALEQESAGSSNGTPGPDRAIRADADTGADVHADTDADTADDADAYMPAVELSAGYLPGSLPVSAAASTTPGRGGRLDRAAMPAHVRATIQIAVAGSLAVIIGDALSGQRLYWAVISTFLAFMATTNSAEQVRKALFRVAGTALGIVVGDLLVHLTGGDIWTSLIIVLVALFFGIYLIRVNYTFMVIGITVTMSQLYKQLGEFSWHLLLLRLEETAIGVGCVVVTVLVIFPLRPQRVLTAGVLIWFRALSEISQLALAQLVDGQPRALRPAVRQLDAAFAALEATAAPLRSTTFGRNSAQLREIRSISAAGRGYARSLAAVVEAAHAPPLPALVAMADQVRASDAAIEARIDTGVHGVFVRSSALVERAYQDLAPEQAALRPALRDLTMLDGTLARLATALQMQVRDHDTTDAAESVMTGTPGER